MKKHTVRLGRLLACIMMPLVMGASMAQAQELADFRDVIVRDQPGEIRVRTSMSEATLTIGEPRLWHDTIVGFNDGGSVRVPLADVTDLTVFKVSRPHSWWRNAGSPGVITMTHQMAPYNAKDAFKVKDPTDTGVGKALLGGAALVYLFYASLDFGEIGDAMARSISR